MRGVFRHDYFVFVGQIFPGHFYPGRLQNGNKWPFLHIQFEGASE